MKYFTTMVFLLVASALAMGQADSAFWARMVPATVTGVHDGDSYLVRFDDGQRTRIRIADIDCPEIYAPGYVARTQTMGREVGDSVRMLLKGKRVLLDTTTLRNARDRYGRLVADVYLPDSSMLQMVLVERGWAWAEPNSGRRRSNLNQVLRQMQAEARKQRKGIFGFAIEPVRPTTWKRKWGF